MTNEKCQMTNDKFSVLLAFTSLGAVSLLVFFQPRMLKRNMPWKFCLKPGTSPGQRVQIPANAQGRLLQLSAKAKNVLPDKTRRFQPRQ